jgi:predicted RNA-binding Zn-ribbon protein involved in translation (DUF1610 family)
VTGDFFLSRDNEISEIVSSAKAHKNIVIYGERRIGKSSLLAETARRNAKDFIFVNVDGCAVANENQFLDCLTREIIRSGVGKAWRVEPALWDLLSTRRMRAALSPGGDLAIATRTRANMPELAATEKARSGSSGPSEANEPGIRMCPRCGRPLKWIEAYKRYFCYGCKKYAPRQKKRSPAKDGEWEPTASPDSCPDCSSPMKYVHRYSEYYCPKCGGYPQLGRRILSEPWAREDMMAALDLPQKLSELKGKPVIMMLDDVQEIAELGDGRIAEAMRLKFEEHEDATYVFAGNSDEAIRLAFEDRNGAFYKFAKTIVLGRIPDPEMQRFLVSRFRSGGGRLAEGAAQRIVGVSEGMPGYAQQIGHELFHLSHSPEMSDVEAAIGSALRQQSSVYSLLWDSIRSPLHRRYLFAVAREPKVPHGEAFVRRYGLKSRSHVQRIEGQLEARGVIARGEIVDPMFVLWLRRSNSV